jgi:hypothetical protein
MRKHRYHMRIDIDVAIPCEDRRDNHIDAW